MTRRLAGLLPLLLIMGGLLLFSPAPALAFHDQGYPCYQCHSLRPGDSRPGSRAIRQDQPVLATIPPTATPWAGGNPITCDFCHRSASDIPTLNMASRVSFGGTKHPVDLIQTGDNTSNPREITCNDCHNGGANELTSTSLLVRGAGTGYPDHKNVDNVYAHNLTNNPPHLSQPYWGATLPGVTRANDTTFWTAVQANTQNIVCWVCHDGAQLSPFTSVRSIKNIRSEYTTYPGSARGHQIQTAVGGALGVGSALPCYDCHDSHGTVNSALVLDNQSIYGALTSQLAVTSYTGARPRNDKAICAQCHDTGNPATAGTKLSGVGKVVEGLYPVDPYNSTLTSGIHISAGVADNLLLSTKNCLAVNSGCHASPHNPVGESTGGQNCSVCHSAIYQAMDAGSSTGYHHVMLADNAPIGGTYPNNPAPTSTSTDRTCLICHVDHNYFNKTVNSSFSRARNLRSDILVQPDNGANVPRNTDFDNTLGSGGICTSCHQNAQAKNTPGTNIKNDGVASTAVVSKTLYNFGAHSYPAVSPFITSHFTSDNTLVPSSYFQANCSKCHNDTNGTNFQDNTGNEFALHSSDGAAAINNILAPLGYSPLTDNLTSNFCYRCHSKQGQLANGKPANGRDYYNVAGVVMDNAAESVYTQFARTSRHPVNAADQAAGKVVDCLNCHNVHATRSTTGSVVAQTDNTYAFATYNLTDNSQAGVLARSNWCITCHDGAAPTQTVSASSYVPITVQISNPLMNKNLYAPRGHWTASGTGSLIPTTVKACDACHDKHGSTARRLLGVFDNNDGVNKINGVPVSATQTAADNAAVCNSCHTAVGGAYPPTVPTFTPGGTVATQEGYRDGTGYFSTSGQVIRWPGKATWDCTVFSAHNTSAKNGPAGLGARPIADCNGCHDPHGTAYNYNMLTDNMAAGNYRLCFDCHGLSGSPAVDNIAQYYPAAAQGLGAAASATVNTGHNIKTGGGLLPQYTALPCYDCHVVHGSRNGNTQLKSDQRWAGLGDTRNNAANSRVFCLGCHLASDDAATTGTVENLQRQTAGLNKLKLPTTNPIVEHQSGSTQGCGVCHAGRTINDNTYSPHNPASGLCDLCHESQGAKSSVAATYNGAHLAHVDNTTYRFACKQCHSWTATINPANHKNDAGATQHAEVRFDNQAASWSYIQYATPTNFAYRTMYANPYGASATIPVYAVGVDNATVDSKQASVRWTTGTCSQVWCHSTGYSGDNVSRSPQWTPGSLPADCTGCHGNNASSANRMGAAGWGSPAHLTHINNGYECSSCHRGTVGSLTSRTITVYDNHVNGVANVLAGDNAVFAYDNATHTCSNISCHSGNAANWFTSVGQLSCVNCHVRTGDLDDFGTGPVASMFNNGITAGIDNTEWLYSGHGRDTGSFDCTAAPAPNLVGASTGKNKCKFCHDDTIAHDNVSNPFRLANTNWQSLGWDGNCFICHSGIAGKAATGYQPPQDNASLTYTLKNSTFLVGDAHYNPGSVNNARHSTTYNGGKFCWDCHDPHGDRVSGSGNIVMIGKKVSRATDNVFGIPVGGTAGADRVSPTFVARTTGKDYASTDNVGLTGICEVCHLAASGVTHFYSTASSNHYTSRCIDCHGHDAGFRGSGGNNIEQFFDNSYRVDSASNYKDMSGHRLRTDNVLDTAGQVNCYTCHGVANTNRVQNECLKCHFENRTAGTPAHPNAVFEWATAGSPTVQFGAAGPATDAFCLQCHGTGGTVQLGNPGVAPPVVIPAGEGGWTAANASGHGATATLSGGFAGPPAYTCRDCHYSNAAQSGGSARDNYPPGFHASINRKLVRNDNIAAGGAEYPAPADTNFTTNTRSGRMDRYCATTCHRNLTNGQAKDDNVADHTWDLLGGEVQSGSLSHPSNMATVPAGQGSYYRSPDNLPLSESLVVAPPSGTGNVVCVTCHNPHGGGSVVDKVGTPLTAGGKQMIRRSFSDNASTICKECHS